MSASFEIKIGRQAFLESLQTKLPLDVCLFEALREHRVGAQQREKIRSSVFNLVRFWPLFFESCEEFNTENPSWLRKLSESLEACLETSSEDFLKRHESKKPQASKNLEEHLRRLHPIKNFFFQEFQEEWAAWHDYFHSQLQAPPFSVRLNLLKGDRENFLRHYERHGLRPSAFIPGAFYFSERWNVAEDPGFESGLFEVQDDHSQLVSLLADPKEGETVLDLCAGGGGKTLHLASLLQGKGEVYAYDISAAKLKRLGERARRAGLSNIRICSEIPFPSKRRFDVVLVDAPCTGLGTLRRSPDRLLQMEVSEFSSLSRLQNQLLDQGHSLVKEGGRLVYATCSVRPEENILKIRDFAESRGLKLLNPLPILEKWLGKGSANFLSHVQESPACRLSKLNNLTEALQLGPTLGASIQTSGGLLGDGFFIGLLST